MNYHEIKKWLFDRHLRIIDVAERAGVAPCTVTLTMQGKRRASYGRVRKALKKMGCPKEFLRRAKKQIPPNPPFSKGGENGGGLAKVGDKVRRLEACATREA